MMDKSICRSYINEKKPFLNISAICRELGIQQAHVSWFLKSYHYDHYLTEEKANTLVEFIRNISN